MLTYSALSKNPSLFAEVTGLDLSAFDSLYRRVESRYDESEERRLSRPNRKKSVGEGGRPFKLELRERLLMLLVHHRLHITLSLTHSLFGLDLSNVWRDIRYLEPVVQECAPLPRRIHDEEGRLGRMEDLEPYLPGFRAFVNSTSRESGRARRSEEVGPRSDRGEREG